MNKEVSYMEITVADDQSFVEETVRDDAIVNNENNYIEQTVRDDAIVENDDDDSSSSSSSSASSHYHDHLTLASNMGQLRQQDKWDPLIREIEDKLAISVTEGEDVDVKVEKSFRRNATAASSKYNYNPQLLRAILLENLALEEDTERYAQVASRKNESLETIKKECLGDQESLWRAVERCTREIQEENYARKRLWETEQAELKAAAEKSKFDPDTKLVFQKVVASCLDVKMIIDKQHSPSGHQVSGSVLKLLPTDALMTELEPLLESLPFNHKETLQLSSSLLDGETFSYSIVWYGIILHVESTSTDHGGRMPDHEQWTQNWKDFYALAKKHFRPPNSLLLVGTKVTARSKDGQEYHSGKIVRSHPDGTFDIRYDDGEVTEENVPANLIQAKSRQDTAPTEATTVTPTTTIVTTPPPPPPPTSIRELGKRKSKFLAKSIYGFDTTKMKIDTPIQETDERHASVVVPKDLMKTLEVIVAKEEEEVILSTEKLQNVLEIKKSNYGYHHFELAHKVLRNECFDNTLYFFNNLALSCELEEKEEQQSYLAKLWTGICHEYDSVGPAGFDISDLKIENYHDDNTTDNGNNNSKSTLLLITMPPPDALAQAYYIGIVFSLKKQLKKDLPSATNSAASSTRSVTNRIIINARYFILENGGPNKAYFCEWREFDRSYRSIGHMKLTTDTTTADLSGDFVSAIRRFVLESTTSSNDAADAAVVDNNINIVPSNSDDNNKKEPNRNESMWESTSSAYIEIKDDKRNFSKMVSDLTMPTVLQQPDASANDTGNEKKDDDDARQQLTKDTPSIMNVKKQHDYHNQMEERRRQRRQQQEQRMQQHVDRQSNNNSALKEGENNNEDTTCNTEDDDWYPTSIKIIVTVYAGRNLIPKDCTLFTRRPTTSDPYVKVYIGNSNNGEVEHFGTTSIKMETLNPEWGGGEGEHFVLHVGTIKFQSNKMDLIICKIKDYDRLSKSDPMGTVTIPIPNDIKNRTVQMHERRSSKRQRVVKNWFPVEKGSGKHYCEDASGELLVGLEIM